MRKRIKELKKKKEKNDEVVTNEKVEEKGLSKEEKQKSKEYTYQPELDTPTHKSIYA